ncbi:MBL fold metallo-hydrolase, partial [Nocardia farcinica]|uniref:MBL fold metallo-hydrolase n=1 Tax=Nocardia farcinica TaxID=37329 RepID=UPI001E2DEEE6
AVLIDAANEADRILELVEQEMPGKVRLIVTTHQHPDHWAAQQQVAAALDVPTAAHALDAEPLPVRTAAPRAPPAPVRPPATPASVRPHPRQPPSRSV